MTQGHKTNGLMKPMKVYYSRGQSKVAVQLGQIEKEKELLH